MSSYKRNYERNGVEIYFERKPSTAVRDLLKNNGWRWSGFSKCWYNYYSEQNYEFAKRICGEKKAVDKKPALITSEKPVIKSRAIIKDRSIKSKAMIEDGSIKNRLVIPNKPITSEPIVKEKKVEIRRQIKSTKPPFSEDESCIVSCENDEKRFGYIQKINIDDKQAEVRYIISINSKGEKYSSEWFNFSNIKAYSTYTKDEFIYRKTIVSFITEKGLVKKGMIIDSDYDITYYGRTYKIKYYEVDDFGSIIEKISRDVKRNRIIDVLKYETDILPVKKGEKVEYERDINDKVIGRVSDISYDGKVSINYSYIDIWGDRVEDCIYNVPLDKLHIMAMGRRVLNRTAYISDEKQKSININERIKERIKNRLDTFPDAKGVSQNRVLYRHQKAGTILAEMYDKFAFFYDTGTGKTVMALDIIAKKQHKDNARFLIIAPKSIIKTAWMDDAAKYYPNLRILPLYSGFGMKKKRNLLYSWRNGNRVLSWEWDPSFYSHVKLISDAFGLGEIEYDDEEVIEEALKASAQHYIINSELFIRSPEKYINELNISGIIMDESAILKNYRGKTAEIMRKVSEKMRYVYLLSGKPAPNNVTEYFSQMKIVDPDTFPMSYESFVSMFCYNNGGKLDMIPANRKLFAEMVSVRSLIISKKDCLDLPGTIDVVRQIDLPKNIMQDYIILYQECMAIIKGMDKSELVYSTQSRLAVFMKLRQMASGFFMAESDEDSNKIIIDIHNAKIKELNAIMDQIPEEQVIIWCQFQHEIELVYKELSKRAYTVTAYGKTKDVEKNIDDFKNGRAQYIVAHPKTLKYGVTFVNCKYTVYYSFSYSAEDYDQSHDRNYRLGQTETCTYMYIQAADTIDEVMYAKVMYKLSDAEFFEQLIKDAAKHGIDYDSLKEKNDYEIKEALAHGSGSLHDLTMDIFSKQEMSERRDDDYDVPKLFSTYDYLGKIDGPSPSELIWIKDDFIKDKTCMYLEDGPYEWKLFDTTRPDYFDFIHAEEPYEEFNVNMSYDRYRAFLEMQPQEYWWVYEMYRKVDEILKRMPNYTAEVLREKYGLKAGRAKSNKTIVDKMRGKYHSEYGDTWNMERVSEEINEGLCLISNSSSLREIAGKIKYVFFS